MEVEGECDVFTGRIVADGWAGRPIRTKHGVRYRAPDRPIRLPATVRLVIVEPWQPGSCPKAPKLREIPENGGQEMHWLPAISFTASQRGKEGARALDVQEVKFDFSSLGKAGHAGVSRTAVPGAASLSSLTLTVLSNRRVRILRSDIRPLAPRLQSTHPFCRGNVCDNHGDV